ncbi:MAG: hypothetical protein ABGY96_02635 [bacterium]|nr:hypothetical protein [Gammaproteobacteria bacterium]HIL95061.1 hypothetical protein [Pseudomonadales bacterium]
MRNRLVGLGGSRVLISLSIVLIALSAFAENPPGDPNQEILKQLNEIAPNAEQLDAFKEVFREYYRQRNDASRRILRTGGDVAIKMEMKLSQITAESIESMSAVITAEQLEKYEVLLGMLNQQFLASSGLN